MERLFFYVLGLVIGTLFGFSLAMLISSIALREKKDEILRLKTVHKAGRAEKSSPSFELKS